MNRRFRLVARVVLAVWLVSVALALLSTVLRAPVGVVHAAWFIVAGGWFVLFQAYLLAGVQLEDGIEPNSASWLAVAWVPWMLVSGPVVLAGGLLILTPASTASSGVKMAGAFAAAWGALALTTAIFALRKKRRERLASRT